MTPRHEDTVKDSYRQSDVSAELPCCFLENAPLQSCSHRQGKYRIPDNTENAIFRCSEKNSTLRVHGQNIRKVKRRLCAVSISLLPHSSQETVGAGHLPAFCTATHKCPCPVPTCVLLGCTISAVQLQGATHPLLTAQRGTTLPNSITSRSRSLSADKLGCGG